MRFFALSLFAVLSLFASGLFAQEAACGDSESPWRVETGTYHFAMPEGVAPKGLVIYLHGAGGRASGLLTSGIGREAVARGYAFVAPQGFHPDTRFVRNWSVRATNSVFEKDDAVFLRDVLLDVRSKTGLEGGPTLLAGFSRGGSMVWDIACHDPAFATAYAPMAGAFWDAMPDSCAAPVTLFHTHGWNDRTVPLEGRSLRGGTIVQGDVWESLKILRATNGCDARQPERNSYEGEFWFRHWTDCEAGKIELMLHKGGHGAPQGWSSLMLDWFDAQSG